MFFALMAVLPFLHAEVLTGNCGAQGDNVTYTLDTETGLLTISGTGAMAGYEGVQDLPWKDYRSKITHSIIEDGVTGIGKYAFYSCSNMTSIDIPNSVSSIGNYAFGSCDELAEISIPNSVTDIGMYVFYNCKCDVLYFPTKGRSSTFLFFRGTLYKQNTLDIEDLDVPVKSLNDYCLDLTTDYNFYDADVFLAFMPKFINQTVDSVYYTYTYKYGSSEREVESEVEKGADGRYSYDSYDEVNTVTVYTTINNEDRILYYNISTEVGRVKIESTSSTQSTISCHISYSKPTNSIVKIDSIGFSNVAADGNGVATKRGLMPKTMYEYNVCMWSGGISRNFEDENGKWVGFGIRTKGANFVEIKAKTTISTIELIGTYDAGDATVSKTGFCISRNVDVYDDFLPDTIRITGLLPNTPLSNFYSHFRYVLVYNYFPGIWDASSEIYYSTDLVKFMSEPAQPTSTSSVRLKTKTNLDGTETKAGYQWRRYDAPDELPSTEVLCPVVDNMLVGSLRNVNSEVYYKCRPFACFTDSDGKDVYYYGEWVVFFTGDAAMYFEPEVLTFEPESVSADGAVLSGYALEGTDEIKKQGFEYWPVDGGAMLRSAAPGQVQTVFASGIKMEVELTGLAAGTTYAYRAFATTDEGTIYGTEMQFTTEPASGIAEVVASEAEGLAVMLRGNPVDDGTAWVKVSGASGQVLRYRINSLSGQTVGGGILPDYDGWNAIDASFAAGLYLLTVDDGLKSKTVKMIVR